MNRLVLFLLVLFAPSAYADGFTSGKLTSNNTSTTQAIRATAISSAIPLRNFETQSPGKLVNNTTASMEKPTAVTNSSSVTSKTTGAPAPRTFAARGADIINARDYGAICNGASHPLSGYYGTLAAAQAAYPLAGITALTWELDEAAINQAIGVGKAVSNGGVNAAYVQLPKQSQCWISYGINATNITGYNFVIDGNGTSLYGYNKGTAVFDALGSSNLKIRDLDIVGATSGHIPNVGIQFGRGDRSFNDGLGQTNTIENISTEGNFTLAGLVDISSEVTLMTKLSIGNGASSASAFSAIFDGINHWSCSSVFVTCNQPANTAKSFENSVCVSCTFASGNGQYVNVWIANAGITFVAPYFHNGDAPYFIELYNIPSTVIYPMQFINAHGDGSAQTSAFYIDASAASSAITLNGIKWEDQYPNYTTTLFKSSNNISAVYLNELDVELGAAGVGPTKIFDTPSIYTSSGQIHTATSSQFNAASGQFSGLACYGIASTPTCNSYATQANSSTLRAIANANLTVGNATDGVMAQFIDCGGRCYDYINFFGVTRGAVDPLIDVGGNATNINLRLAGQGTGIILVGGLADNGTKFTATGSGGGCGTIGAITGGSMNGKFVTANVDSCQVTVIFGGATGKAAPSDTNCSTSDATTPLHTGTITSTSTTATITYATITAGDTIKFGCMGF